MDPIEAPCGYLNAVVCLLYSSTVSGVGSSPHDSADITVGGGGYEVKAFCPQLRACHTEQLTQSRSRFLMVAWNAALRV